MLTYRVSALFACCWCLVAAVAIQAQDMPLSDILIEGEEWQQLGDGYKFTEGPAADAQGNVFFTDIPNNKIYKIDAAGEITLFASDTAATNGLMFGPDGRLYGCRNGEKKIVAYDVDGKMQTVAEGAGSNDLVVTSKGEIYFTDPPSGQVWHVNAQGEKRVVAEDLQPNGIILWPGEETLVVTDRTLPLLWTFRVETDGSLKFKEQYYSPLAMISGATRTGSDGMTIDKEGRLYVTTLAGLQVFDPTGRLSGVIRKPQEKSISNVTFGGAQFDYLYVTSVDKVYRRKTKTAGVSSQLHSRGN